MNLKENRKRTQIPATTPAKTKPITAQGMALEPKQ